MAFGIDRPKAADPEMKGSQKKQHNPARIDDRDAKACAEDKGKERLREPQEHRADRDAEGPGTAARRRAGTA